MQGSSNREAHGRRKSYRQLLWRSAYSAICLSTSLTLLLSSGAGTAAPLWRSADADQAQSEAIIAGANHAASATLAASSEEPTEDSQANTPQTAGTELTSETAVAGHEDVGHDSSGAEGEKNLDAQPVSIQGDPAATEEADRAESESSTLTPVEQNTPQTSPAPAFRRAAARPFECQGGSIYSVNVDGQIYRVGQNQAITTMPDAINSMKGDPNTQSNALAIEAGGKGAFAIRQWIFNNRAYYLIYHYDADTGQWTDLFGDTHHGRLTAFPVRPFIPPFIAGAVQFDTGDYYYGAIRAGEDNQAVFEVWRYNVKSGTAQGIGHFEMGVTLPSATVGLGEVANGDMAFDKEGNLFVVRSGPNEAEIYSITKAELSRAQLNPSRDNRLFAPSAGVVARQGRGAANGIAFDARGRLYLGSQTKVTRHDPLDFTDEGVVYNALNRSTDLATCESPATIYLVKNIEGRVDQRDQFTLSLGKVRDGAITSNIPDATTTGNGTGLHTRSGEYIGVFPVGTGSTFRFSERMAPGSPSALSDYNTYWQCQGTSGLEIAGRGSTGTVTIPEVDSVKVYCVITNSPLKGQLTWEKVGANNQQLYLGGSEWNLEGPNRAGKPAIVDCVQATCPAGGDLDSRPGRFRVENLTLGSYTLSEKTAPEGYALTTTPKGAELTKTRQSASFGKIPNERIRSEVIVLNQLKDVDTTALPGVDASGWQMGVDINTTAHQDVEIISPAVPGNKRSGDKQTSTRDGRLPQPWVIGFPAESGTPQTGASATITVSERMQPGWENESLVCAKRSTVPGANRQETQILREYNLPTHNGMVSKEITVGAREHVTCTFANKRIAAEIRWSKTDQAGRKLEGSEWIINGPDQQNVRVKDCVKPNYCRGTNDQNPAPGEFHLPALKWGTYTLTEDVAPLGYHVDRQTRQTTVNAQKLTHNFGNIINRQIAVPPLPLTGGASADFFLVGGVGIGFLALTTHGMNLYRRRRGRE